MNKVLEEISLTLTKWVGTTTSIVAHTLLFIGAFGLHFLGVGAADILLILTTAVSLEAVYLSIFIQMTVNRHEENLKEVGADVEEIHGHVEELGENVEDISEDINELQEEGSEDDAEETQTKHTLTKIEGGLQQLVNEIEALKGHIKEHHKVDA